MEIATSPMTYLAPNVFKLHSHTPQISQNPSWILGPYAEGLVHVLGPYSEGLLGPPEFPFPKDLGGDVDAAG